MGKLTVQFKVFLLVVVFLVAFVSLATNELRLSKRVESLENKPAVREVKTVVVTPTVLPTPSKAVKGLNRFTPVASPSGK